MDKSLRHKSGGVLALIMLAPFVLIRELPAQTFTPCSSAAYHEFDFWVGNWDVSQFLAPELGDESRRVA
jgi:hypothetical protein